MKLGFSASHRGEGRQERFFESALSGDAQCARFAVDELQIGSIGAGNGHRASMIASRRSAKSLSARAQREPTSSKCLIANASPSACSA
jgi:hypothetical protein